MGRPNWGVEAVRKALGRKINSIKLEHGNAHAGRGGDELHILFAGGDTLVLWDGGQSCCERRYMVVNDDLSYHVGAKLRKLELREGTPPPPTSVYEEDHEVQFLDITTSNGVVQIANHNEHNGYYGGFWIKAKLVERERTQ